VTQRILVVEDEEDLAATLKYRLEREGFECSIAGRGDTALELAFARTPDLVLLDLMLPDMAGVKVCRALRADARTANVPIIMVTAKADEVDRIGGFEAGADDYVCKPFSPRELVLRIQARLRAAGGQPAVDALEFRLLVTLLERKGRVQSRSVLLKDVWGITADITTRTVDTHIKRLRRKIGDAGEYIETLRGVGYRFKDQP
jgi:two-component system phosphate regulon response regulator PhoB